MRTGGSPVACMCVCVCDRLFDGGALPSTTPGLPPPRSSGAARSCAQDPLARSLTPLARPPRRRRRSRGRTSCPWRSGADLQVGVRRCASGSTAGASAASSAFWWAASSAAVLGEDEESLYLARTATTLLEQRIAMAGFVPRRQLVYKLVDCRAGRAGGAGGIRGRQTGAAVVARHDAERARCKRRSRPGAARSCGGGRRPCAEETDDQRA